MFWTNPANPSYPDEVQVEVKAAGINFAGVIMRAWTDHRHLYRKHKYGGVIRRVGSAVKDFARSGRSSVWNGVWEYSRLFVRNKVHTTIPIPDHLPFSDAVPGCLVNGAVWNRTPRPPP
jgi:NADPH:quinone reductase-like Zn-dependent oxidoreductase